MQVLAAVVVGALVGCGAPCEGDHDAGALFAAGGGTGSLPGLLGGGGGTGPGGPCVDATEPNDTALRSFVLASGATQRACMQSDDLDIFSVTAGPQVAGGYFTASVTTATQTTPGLLVDVGTEQASWNIYARDALNPVRLYWASLPGIEWNVRTRQGTTDGGEPLPYDISVTWTPVTDAFEPNNTQADAKPITLGTPIQALLVGPKKPGVSGSESVDYYRFTQTAAKRVRVRLTNAPSSVTPVIRLECPTCSSQQKAQTSPGQDVDLLSTSTIGTAEVFVVVWNDQRDSDSGQLVRDLPSHFTQPYTLTVTTEP
jgi:hypothetical protein